MPDATMFDRSLKILVRDVPDAFCRLLDRDVPPGRIRFDDVSVNVPELRADNLMVIGTKDNPPERGLYWEFAIQPSSQDDLERWLTKVANLNDQRDYSVGLAVIYLTRGRYRRFPTSVIIQGVVPNKFLFHSIQLWEHRERIRHGDLQALAPLLVLCEEQPTERTLWDEKAIIQKAVKNRRRRDKMFALSLMVGRKYFDEAILLSVFREGLPMIKEMNFVEEWISEGEARGKAEGERQMVMRVLNKKFGEIPPAARERIGRADPEWCERMLDQALDAASFGELDLS